MWSQDPQHADWALDEVKWPDSGLRDTTSPLRVVESKNVLLHIKKLLLDSYPCVRPLRARSINSCQRLASTLFVSVTPIRIILGSQTSSEDCQAKSGSGSRIHVLVIQSESLCCYNPALELQVFLSDSHFMRKPISEAPACWPWHSLLSCLSCLVSSLQAMEFVFSCSPKYPVNWQLLSIDSEVYFNHSGSRVIPVFGRI